YLWMTHCSMPIYVVTCRTYCSLRTLPGTRSKARASYAARRQKRLAASCVENLHLTPLHRRRQSGTLHFDDKRCGSPSLPVVLVRSSSCFHPILQLLLLSREVESPEVNHCVHAREKTEEAPDREDRINWTKGQSEQPRVEVMQNRTGKVTHQGGRNQYGEHDDGDDHRESATNQGARRDV